MIFTKKPAPPTTFRIFLRDSWSVGVAAILLVLGISSAWFFISTPTYSRNEAFYQVLGVVFVIPMALGIPFLLWRVPRRVRHIHAVWNKGEVVVGQISNIFYGSRSVPSNMSFRYNFAGEDYNSSVNIASNYAPHSSGQLALIVNPDNPKEVLVIDLYL